MPPEHDKLRRPSINCTDEGRRIAESLPWDIRIEQFRPPCSNSCFKTPRVPLNTPPQSALDTLFAFRNQLTAVR